MVYDEFREHVTQEEIDNLGLGNITENKVFYYLYMNKDYKFNVVEPKDIINHIGYNRIFRPGRIMYMEDSEKVFIRLNNGMLKEDKLVEYDQLAKEWFETKGKQISKRKATIPYC